MAKKLRAAIYARKSTDEGDKAKENKSVEVQIRDCKQVIAEMGWKLNAAHIYYDDAVSGARLNRPGLDRLKEAAKNKEFDILVVRDRSRLYRNNTYATAHMKTHFIKKKVEIYFYLDGEYLDLNGVTKTFISQSQDMGAALHRENSRKAAIRGLKPKVEKGCNTGGRLYGYDNYWIYPDGREEYAPPRRRKPEDASYTDYKINKEQAAVVTSIFEMYADGYGYAKIAKTANGDPQYEYENKKYFDGKCPEKPKVGKRGTGSWATTAIRDMLHNEFYTGVIKYGRVTKEDEEDENGKPIRVKNTPDKVQTKQRPELRIIDKPLWNRVQKRLKQAAAKMVRDGNGTLWGRVEDRGVSNYLLGGGIMRCGQCGGPMEATSQPVGPRGKHRLVKHYRCAYHTKRGTTVCTNNIKPRMDEAHDLILGFLKQKVLSPAVIEKAVDMAVDKVKELNKIHPDRPKVIKKEIAKLEKELANFIDFVASGTASATIKTKILEHEQQLDELKVELANYQDPKVTDLSTRKVRADLKKRIGEFNDLLTSNAPRARVALRKLLQGYVVFEPLDLEQKAYALKGQTDLWPLLASKKMASPRGNADATSPLLLGFYVPSRGAA